VKKIKLEDKLYLVKTKKDRLSHIWLDRQKCSQCRFKACLVVCPANTYEEINGRIEHSYENCLECGSCRVACQENAICWENPRGGFGVTFING
jgi:ferredoxin like protein